MWLELQRARRKLQFLYYKKEEAGFCCHNVTSYSHLRNDVSEIEI